MSTVENFQHPHILPLLEAPGLDTLLQMEHQKGTVEEGYHLPFPAGHLSCDAAQNIVGIPGCNLLGVNSHFANKTCLHLLCFQMKYESCIAAFPCPLHTKGWCLAHNDHLSLAGLHVVAPEMNLQVVT